MKNPNSKLGRLTTALKERWEQPDYPGGDPRFQIRRFGRDALVHLAFPMAAFILWQGFSQASSTPRKTPPRSTSQEILKIDASKSQIIEFHSATNERSASFASKRAPGTLVRVKLLNVVEAYSTAPVHAQIVDGALGPKFLGGTLIGDGTGDANFDRMNIIFKIARDTSHEGSAYAISARALSLNGTLGLEAEKKEGAFARAVYGAGTPGATQVATNIDSMDLRSIVVKALTAGLAQEFGSGSQIEGNRATVLALRPGLEFLAELTDYFPTAGR
jgi:hypothetical protein